MNQTRRKSFFVVAVVLLLIMASCFLIKRPNVMVATETLQPRQISSSTKLTQIIVPDADSFGQELWGQAGIYIYVPTTQDDNNYFWGSVSAEILLNNKVNFAQGYNPYTAMFCHNGVWEEANPADFEISSDAEIEENKRSVLWYLHETAPTGVYGVRCRFTEDNYNWQEYFFRIVYTKETTWTYIKAANINGGDMEITDWFGGINRELRLEITFNDGATVSVLDEPENTLNNGASYGPIDINQVISANSLEISVQTTSGLVYNKDKIVFDVLPGTNIMRLTFLDKLVEETYVVKIASKLDSKVYGQFVINNKGSAKGVNLSTVWVLVTITGGVLMLFAAGAFFVPLGIARLNKNKVYKENQRIAREKNPGAFVAEDGNFLQRLATKLKKGKKTATEEAVVLDEEKTQVEDEPRKASFAERLREKKEEHDSMRQYGVSNGSQLEKIKKAESQDTAKQSFAFLRDDDDEIAAFKEEKEEKATIETGSYVEDGVTFSKLDSMRDDE